jgi:broad specificity phosphatase PhoE
LGYPFRLAYQLIMLTGCRPGGWSNCLRLYVRTVDIHAGRPGWNVWRDGCPHGETPANISDRADTLLIRLRELSGNVALFTHGQLGSALAARWIGLPVIEAQRFALSPASSSILAHGAGHPKVPVNALWNARADRSLSR